MKRGLIYLVVILIVFISACAQKSEGDIKSEPTEKRIIPSQDGLEPVRYNPQPGSVQEAVQKFGEKYGIKEVPKRGGFLVQWHESLESPQFMGGFRSSQYSGTPKQVAFKFLEEHGDLIGLEDNSLFFSEVYQISSDSNENQVSFKQIHQEAEFYNVGGEVKLIVTNDNRVRTLSGEYLPPSRIKTSSKSELSDSVLKDLLFDYLVNLTRSEKGEVSEEDIDYLRRIINTRIPERFIYPIDENKEFVLSLLYRFPSSFPYYRVFQDPFNGDIIGKENSPY